MRKCTSQDKNAILNYISKEPEMNLFIYGDVENLGLESEIVNVYVEEKEVLYSQKPDYDTVAESRMPQKRPH
ncbi:MAG: hypothetical protein SO016_11230 [Lachnospiraceae bacterium]|nr:hypothetical protein [Robinsoniella sp.]MDY3767237.1 hypothetical protein [Lachnospiraceae bacterium]